MKRPSGIKVTIEFSSNSQSSHGESNHLIMAAKVFGIKKGNTFSFVHIINRIHNVRLKTLIVCI